MTFFSTYTKHTLLAFFFFLCLATLPAQTLGVAVSTNRVPVGESFELQYSATGNGAGFQAPAFTDFNVLSGPEVSKIGQTINGSFSQIVYFSYYLSPKKEGKLTISPASITAGGKRVESNSLVIEATKGTSNSLQPGGNGEDLFVKAIPDRSKVYLGEQVILTHKVYFNAKASLEDIQGAKMPSYSGFWSQDAKNPGNGTVSKETTNGVVYTVVDLKKTYLFPQKTGTLLIDPIEIGAVVRKENRTRNAWSMFGFGSEQVLIKIKCPAISIEVLPLPESGKPSAFSGAVGQFSFKVQMNKDKVKTNEAINLSLTITGRGNLNLIDPPKLVIPPDIESYDPKTSESIGTKTGGIEGSKTAEYILIPRHHGTYKISPVEFSYFDPSTKNYITLHSPEFTIQVEKGEGESNNTNTLTPAGNRNEIAIIGTDIRYIKTQPFGTTKKGNHFFGSIGFRWGFIAPGLSFLLLIVLRRKYKKDNSDLKLVKSRKATRMAQKSLTVALSYLQAGNKEKFYEEIFRALYGYLCDKFSLQMSELSKDTITQTLEKNMVSADTIRQLHDTLDACEFARYAPSGASGDLKGIYDKSILLITQLEDQLTKAKTI
jgi:hypothetical protein